MKEHHRAAAGLFSGLEPGTVLDAGSHGSDAGKALEERGFRVISLDLYEAPRVRNGRFVRSDMNGNLPFADGSFDYILCSEALQYLENHALLFREFKRALKKDGQVIISMPNILSAGSRLYLLQRGYYPHFKPYRTVDGNRGWDAAVYHPVSLVEVIMLMGRNGLELKEMKASRMKGSNFPAYIFLKALYAVGLLFERHAEKAGLLRLLSSREALLGDHLALRFARGGGRGASPA